MDDDLEFALESVKDLLGEIKENGGTAEDHLDGMVQVLNRIADDMVLLKIDVGYIAENARKSGGAASGGNINWFVFVILMLVLAHVIHHW